jgi:hypothetical protein
VPELQALDVDHGVGVEQVESINLEIQSGSADSKLLLAPDGDKVPKVDPASSARFARHVDERFHHDRPIVGAGKAYRVSAGDVRGKVGRLPEGKAEVPL